MSPRKTRPKGTVTDSQPPRRAKAREGSFRSQPRGGGLSSASVDVRSQALETPTPPRTMAKPTGSREVCFSPEFLFLPVLGSGLPPVLGSGLPPVLGSGHPPVLGSGLPPVLRVGARLTEGVAVAVLGSAVPPVLGSGHPPALVSGYLGVI